MPSLPIYFRIPLLVVGFISLLHGIAGGLLRLGLELPTLHDEIIAMHGPLMVSGFLGTVISLERAVALGTRWAYVAPLAAGIGGLLLADLPWIFGAALITLGSVTMVAASLMIFQRQQALFTLTLLLGSACWLLGNLLWVGGFGLAQIMPWWIGFLVLTIAGERLELARMRPPSASGKNMFALILAFFLVASAAASMTSTPNMAPLSAILVALALWLLRNDIGSATIRQTGLTRFIAACLLSGYVWLLIGGIIGVVSTTLLPGSTYDAFLHAIFLGFVFSMILGHAPVIFAALMRAKIPYHPMFYLPLVILHASVAARVTADLLAPQYRPASSVANAVALALFIGVMAWAGFRRPRQS